MASLILYRVIAVAAIVGLAVRPAAASTCVGDCQDRGKVDIAELVIGVGIALGLLPVADCEAFANPDGKSTLRTSSKA